MEIKKTILILIACSFTQSLLAQKKNTTGQDQITYKEPITEITVTGRDQIKVLRKKVDLAQDQVHKIFNDLNDDQEFDIHCRMRAPIGTRIPQKECAPNFFYSATENSAHALLGNFMDSNTTVHAIPVTSVISHKNPILREKMLTLMNEDQSLKEAIVKHQELTDELNSRLSSFFGKED